MKIKVIISIIIFLVAIGCHYPKCVCGTTPHKEIKVAKASNLPEKGEIFTELPDSEEEKGKEEIEIKEPEEVEKVEVETKPAEKTVIRVVGGMVTVESKGDVEVQIEELKPWPKPSKAVAKPTPKLSKPTFQPSQKLSETAVAKPIPEPLTTSQPSPKLKPQPQPPEPTPQSVIETKVYVSDEYVYTKDKRFNQIVLTKCVDYAREIAINLVGGQAQVVPSLRQACSEFYFLTPAGERSQTFIWSE